VSLARGSPSREDLASLASKYATLSRLRRERARDGKVAERGVLRALAREFPGSLRELDTVTLEDIERREEALRAASVGGASEPWMAWMVEYHRTMRAVDRPPGGRLNRVVFERLAASFGEPADRIWEALFPARRPGRY
jgi:hypothetical protein